MSELGARGPNPSVDRTGIRALEILLTVDRYGSITRAAEALELSQPTVSATLRRLERHLGFAVVNRTASGSQLTEPGTAAARWAREVVAASDRFETGVATLRERATGSLTVAASMTIAEYLVPVWLSALHGRRHTTATSLRVCNSEEVMRSVLTGTTDIGFVESPEISGGLRHRTVGHDELLVVVARTHRWARLKRALSPADLIEARLLVREPGSGTRDTLERALATVGWSLPAPATVLGSTAAIKTALHDGESVGVLSDLAVHSELHSGELCRIEVEGLDLRRALRIVWPARTPLSEVSSALYRAALRTPSTNRARPGG
ncbi:LysR family transcriptional regulator [Sciscionella sediminilitoris]|uniref:LysR family transcriptional regulator n=1 Tax=Sciscionella sediminilitoris TaxID=1445613 RepID=UPI0007C7631D|nr:LysR family transcriptional regulator [Sciscionella sp. SE31]